MKIRTITSGFEYNNDFKEKKFSEIAELTNKLSDTFIGNGYQVQTKRISTQPWGKYAKTKDELIESVKTIHDWSKKYNIDYFNIGPTSNQKQISSLSNVIKTFKNGFCTSIICNNQELFYDNIYETSNLIIENSKLESQGFANLQFAALCNIEPLTPFYPASYHKGPPSFGIGLENSDILYKIFNKTDSIDELKNNLLDAFNTEYTPIERIAYEFSEKHDLIFNGIDVSISSSIHPKESIAYAFEQLNIDNFGQPATLDIAKIITDVLKQKKKKKIGYNGLMLPVLEDHGLATRNKQNKITITSLLLYSAVCGTGLDTIPLPGDITIQQISNILIDVASLSIKLNKPLSARLMPIPGKKTGDLTEFDFEYFLNSRVMSPI